MQELLTQRIKYLIEHGGVLDDPLADIRRTAKRALWASAGAATLSTVEFFVAVYLMR